MKAMNTKKAAKGRGAAADACGCPHPHEPRLRGAGSEVDADDHGPTRPQTFAGEMEATRRASTRTSTCNDDDNGYNSHQHGGEGTPTTTTTATHGSTTATSTCTAPVLRLHCLCRGGGKKGLKLKQKGANPKTSPTPMPATTAKTSPATPTATKAASPTKKETNVPFEDAELLPEHWSVQACKAEDFRADRDGVALASKATYIAKKFILQGSPNRIAMLLPPTTGTEVEAPLVTVFAKVNNETKQTTRKFVQLGSELVNYEPPASRGPTLRIEPMRTVVLEIIKGTFDEKQWKEQAMNADSAFLQYIKPILEGTRWANARPSRCRPSIYDGKTTSMQSFVRIPDACVSACLKRSGMGDDRVYARVFTERGPEEPRAHANIWLNDRSLEEARMAVQALPDTDFFGLYANHRGFAARILEADAPQYAPLLNGRPYASGDKYVIQGVPRDCAWESLIEAITAMDNPWENFEQAHLVYRQAGAWTVQVKSPLAASLADHVPR